MKHYNNLLMLVTLLFALFSSFTCHAKDIKPNPINGSDIYTSGVNGIRWGEALESAKKRFPDLICTDNSKSKDTKNEIPYRRAFGNNDAFGITCESVIYYFSENKFSVFSCVTLQKSDNDSISTAKIVYNEFTSAFGNAIAVSDEKTEDNGFKKEARWKKGNLAAEISIGRFGKIDFPFGFYILKNTTFAAKPDSQ